MVKQAGYGRSQGRKISEFPADTVLPGDAALTFIAGGVNYQIKLTDFLAALNVTGVIESLGQGIPLYRSSGSINQIRAIDAKSGLFAEQGVSGNVAFSDAASYFVTDTTPHVMTGTAENVYCTTSGADTEVWLKGGDALTGDVIRIYSTIHTTAVNITTAHGLGTPIIAEGTSQGTDYKLPPLHSITLRKAPGVWIEES